VSPTRRALRRFARRPPAVVAGAFLVTLGVAAAFAPRLSPYPPDAIDLVNISAPPSRAHWLGTDENGRDVLTRILYGARVSLAVAAAAMAIAVALGTVLGGVAGYVGGWTDRLVSQLVDSMLGIPLFFLWLMTLTALGPTLTTIVAVLGATGWMQVARVVRSEVLRVRELEYTQAAVALGAPERVILWRHVLPQTVPSIVVGASLATAFAILSESALSYLGIGIQPPAASWGNMLSSAQQFVWEAPWLPVFPGLFILATVLAFNALGDSLRDALDPTA
jgi:peptide/nickel transport system permease protein